jgi:SAM-dependent methyltransferase
MDRDDPAWKGQRDYTPRVLKAYDRIVIGMVATPVWHVPKARLLDGYRQHIRPNHLDVGPGTGYSIVHSGLAPGSTVTLLDPNPHVLAHASRKLEQFAITQVQADVLKPLPVAGPFDSAAMHMVIHCLPGPMTRKARAVEHIAAVLAPDGVFFGATILGTTGNHSWVARRVLTVFNRQGGFDNLDDSEAGLRAMLEASFQQVEIEVVGSAAIFAATSPRVPAPG